MRLKITETSDRHQRAAITGEFVAWTTTVEHFYKVPMMVPCVLIRVGSHIRLVPLKREGYEVEIVILEE